MATFCYPSIDEFLRDTWRDPSKLCRFDITLYMAMQWLAVPEALLHNLIDSGTLDAVRTEDGHIFLDSTQLMEYDLAG